jgi:uncharacterized protein (TIGR02186 family)
MSTWQRLLLGPLVFGIGLCSIPAHANPAMVLAVRHHQLGITTGFTGVKEFLFGNTVQAGDIVVRVTSTNGPAALSRKEQVGPFWLNGGEVHVAKVPQLIYLLSNRPLADIASRAELKRYGLTFRSNLASIPTDTRLAPGGDNLRKVFARLKENDGLYRKIAGDVRIHDGTLFSATIPLPAAVPIGTYRVDTFEFRNGKMIAQQTGSFRVHEVGFERWVSRAAVHDSGAFGVLFTLLAVALGLGLSVSLRPRPRQPALATTGGASAAALGSARGIAPQMPFRSGLLKPDGTALSSRLARSARNCADIFPAAGLAQGGDIEGAVQLMEQSGQQKQA